MKYIDYDYFNTFSFFTAILSLNHSFKLIILFVYFLISCNILYNYNRDTKEKTENTNKT
jgi:hypothetical protein